jgi:EAL domain-containing protein (putative c-di-GMP-specific phosphodiesterase class I)
MSGAAVIGMADIAPRRGDRCANRLLAALDRSEFLVHYQPIVRRRPDGRWRGCGIEALIRWRDAAGRWINPERTVALAESRGLSLTLTSHVLERALEQLHRCDSEGLRLDLSINLLPSTFTDRRFPAILAAAADCHEVSPQRITVELSEAYPMPDLNAARCAVHELHQLGVRCAIDDLGVRYATFWRAQTLGVDVVKIDRSLIEHSASNAEVGTTVQSWIASAHADRMEVTAEGVGDHATLEFLDDVRVDSMQGFYIARPVEGCRIRTSIEAWETSPAALSPSTLRQPQLTGLEC